MALALGSGGARGYAHIGTIQVLEERGFEIAAIAGSSMGALVGGLRSAGALGEYTEWATSLTQLDVVRLLDPSLSAPGAIRAEKIIARVRDLIGDLQIEDLPIPFTAVATDLLARREVWFQRGPLERAIRASIAIPSVITPVMLNGRLLADGGIMDPVPIAPLAAFPTDLTVAVDLGGEPRGIRDGAPVQETAAERPSEEWAERVRRGTARLLDHDMVRALRNRFGGEPATELAPDGTDDLAELAGLAAPDGDVLPPGLSKLDVMNLSLDATRSVLTRYRLAAYPPDVLVTVPKDACRSLDFHRAAELIELGRRLTADALDRADDALDGGDDAGSPRVAPRP